MRRLLTVVLTLLVASLSATAMQNANSTSTKSASTTNSKRAVNRGPIFRATKEQIKQAQEVLKQRGHFTGEATGKLDDATRAALKKYQEAENLKVTGTLNKATLEKMNIALTDRQKEWKPAS